MCVCVRAGVYASVCWLQSNADQMKQEIGFLAPSIICRSPLLSLSPRLSPSLSLPPSLLPLCLARSLSVAPSLSLSFSFSLSVSHHRPLSFSHTLCEFAAEPLNLAHNTVTPDRYRWHFPLFFLYFPQEQNIKGTPPQVFNLHSKFKQRQIGFIKVTYDWFPYSALEKLAKNAM